jgi:cysteine-rich repeat protein
MARRHFAPLLVGCSIFLSAPAIGSDVEGVVSLQGFAAFAGDPGGVPLEALRVRIAAETDATGPGVQCSVSGMTAGATDASGFYPASGPVQVSVLMERGGPQPPDGTCLLTVHVSGSDGGEVTAHGVATFPVDAAQIDADALVIAPDVALRVSKAHAGLAKDCKAWSKSRVTLRDKCNAKILQLGGPAAVAKCKEPLKPEPAACDPGDQVEAVLALAHGANDQQVDVPAGEAVDIKALAPQVKCQALFGKAARKFFAALAVRIQNECVKTGDDSAPCRAAQTNALRAKLDGIGDCKADAAPDASNGRTVPAVGDVCAACVTGADVDERCVQDCFELEIAPLASNLVGDVPECGDGIVQNGEFCDDGNLEDDDCCSAACGITANAESQTCGVGACEVTVGLCLDGEEQLCEPLAPPVPSEAGPACLNGVDDDCDGTPDLADPDCAP